MAETKPNLYQKIALITGEVGKIEKTGRNEMQKYNFIEQAVVVAVLREKLSTNNIVIREQVTGKSIEWKEGYDDGYGKIKGRGMKAVLDLKYSVIDADEPTTFFEDTWIAEADDTSDKAVNKALTAGEKTYLMKLFKISDKDDADASSPDAAPPAKPAYQAPKRYAAKIVDQPEPVKNVADDEPVGDATKKHLVNAVNQKGIKDNHNIVLVINGYAKSMFDVESVNDLTEKQGKELLNTINATAKEALDMLTEPF